MRYDESKIGFLEYMLPDLLSLVYYNDFSCHLLLSIVTKYKLLSDNLFPNWLGKIGFR